MFLLLQYNYLATTVTSYELKQGVISMICENMLFFLSAPPYIYIYTHIPDSAYMFLLN